MKQIYHSNANKKAYLKLRMSISFAISILVLCCGLALGASDPEVPFLTPLRTSGFSFIPAAKRIPVILDTDIGTDIDDAFALALALASPEIELRGVTTVSSDAYTRALIVCRFLHAVGRSDVPVAAGRPRRSEPESNGQYRYGLEGDFSNRPVAESAVEFLYRKLKAEPGKITLITIGDLTNIGRLLTDHPEAKPWIRRIVVMGGAVRVGYNGKAPAVWEWNIRSDIRAAQVVFSSGIPLMVAPLDATMVRLEEPLRGQIFTAGTRLSGELQTLYKLWGKSTPVLFDPVALTLAFCEALCTIENLRLEVDSEGVTRETGGNPNAQVAMSIRKEDFLRWYVDRICSSHR
jgi:inosine-uridine nucleoside N-ribohydrolase